MKLSLSKIKEKLNYRGMEGAAYFLFGFILLFIFIGEFMLTLAMAPFSISFVLFGFGLIAKDDMEKDDLLTKDDLQKFRQAEAHSMGILGIVLGLPAWFYLFLLSAPRYGLNFEDPYVYGILLFVVIGYVQLLTIKVRESFENRLRRCPCCGEEYYTLDGIITHVKICEYNPKSKYFKGKVEVKMSD